MLTIDTMRQHERMSTQDLLMAIRSAVAAGETDFQIDASGQQHAIFCRNVDGLTVARNRVNVAGEPVIIEDCTNVENMP